MLEDERNLEKEVGELEKERPDFGSDVDSFDEETDEAEEVANQTGVARVLKERLENVRAALAKLEAGAYGVCEECGGEISPEVLSVAPESRLCRSCKR